MKKKISETRYSKAVLFDMDGVILDSMPYHVKAWQDALSEIGLTVPAELIYLHEGAIEPETAVRIFCENGCTIDEDGFHRLFRRQREIFSSRYQGSVKPYDGVEGLLSRLQEKGWAMSLVTSSHREVLEKVLPGSILGFMSHVVTGDEVKRRKPHPDPYLAAMMALNSGPAEALVVENAPAGVKAAKAAQLKCVALTTTLSAEHLKEADEIVPDHEALADYLLNKGCL